MIVVVLEFNFLSSEKHILMGHLLCSVLVVMSANRMRMIIIMMSRGVRGVPANNTKALRNGEAMKTLFECPTRHIKTRKTQL